MGSSNLFAGFRGHLTKSSQAGERNTPCQGVHSTNGAAWRVVARGAGRWWSWWALHDIHWCQQGKKRSRCVWAQVAGM